MTEPPPPTAYWLCSHCALSSSTSLPYQWWSLEKQAVPGDTGLSSDAPNLRGGTGGALPPSPPPPATIPESVEPSQVTQDGAASADPLAEAAGGLLHATPFSLELPEMSCVSSWVLFWLPQTAVMEGALEDDEREDAEDEEDDAPDLDRDNWFRREGLGLPCWPPAPAASWISSSCLSSSFTTSLM